MNISGESEIAVEAKTIITLDFERVATNQSQDFLMDLSGEDAETIFDKNYVRAILIFLYSVVFGFCFFGNLAVVLVVTLHWRMRSITKFCLGNLAFANLCVGIFCIYQNLTTFLIDRWVFGHFMCKMYHFINSLSHTASILILIVICVERYLAILHPFKSRRWITLTKLRVTIVTVWILSAILSSPRLYYINTIYFPVTSSKGKVVRYDTICAPEHSLYNAPIVDLSYFILLFILPLVIITILCARISVYVWRGSSLLHNKVSFKSELRCNSLRKSSIAFVEGLSNSGSGISTPCKARRFSRGFSYRRRQAIRFSSSSEDSQSNALQSTTELPLCPIDSTNVDTLDTLSVPLSLSEHKNRVGKFSLRIFKRKSNLSKKKSAKKLKHMSRVAIMEALNETQPKLGDRKTDDNVKKNRNESNSSIQSGLLLGINDLSNDVVGNKRDQLHGDACALNPLQTPRKNHNAIKGSKAGSRLRAADVKPRQAVLRMMIAIVVTFAVCNLPFHIRKICISYMPDYEIGSTFSNIIAPVTFLLMYMNCAINPIIYAFMSKDFRSSFLELVKCHIKRNVLRKRESNTTLLNVLHETA